MGVAGTMGIIQGLSSAASGVSSFASKSNGSSTPTTSSAPSSAASAVAGMLTSGALGLIGNALSFNSAGVEANALYDDGDLAYTESMREAARTEEQGRLFQAEQKMKYVMSGVAIQGTPIQVLDDTALKVKDEVNAIRARGEAQRRIQYLRANQTNNEGRAGLLSGILNTTSKVNNIYQSAKNGGIFDKKEDSINGTVVDSNVLDSNTRYA